MAEPEVEGEGLQLGRVQTRHQGCVGCFPDLGQMGDGVFFKFLRRAIQALDGVRNPDLGQIVLAVEMPAELGERRHGGLYLGHPAAVMELVEMIRMEGKGGNGRCYRENPLVPRATDTRLVVVAEPELVDVTVDFERDPIGTVGRPF